MDMGIWVGSSRNNSGLVCPALKEEGGGTVRNRLENGAKVRWRKALCIWPKRVNLILDKMGCVCEETTEVLTRRQQ